MGRNLGAMKPFTLVLLVLVCISSTRAMFYSFLTRSCDWDRIFGLDIRTRDMSGLEVERQNFGSHGFIETFYIPSFSYVHAVYCGDARILQSANRITIVHYYRWRNVDICQAHTVIFSDVYAVRESGEWREVQYVQYRVLDAECAPSVDVHIDGPCVNLDDPGLKCTTQKGRSTFTPVKHYNIKTVVCDGDGGNKLFDLNDHKKERVVSVEVEINIEGVWCVMKVVDEYDEERYICRVIEEGQVRYMTPQELRKWKGFETFDKVMDGLTKVFDAAVWVMTPFYMVFKFPISLMRRYIEGPPRPPPRSSFVIPYDVRAKSEKNAILRSISLLNQHMRYIIYPAKGYRFGPVMYGERCLWNKDSQYVYRVEILDHSSYKMIRLDVFVTHHRTYSVFFQINRAEALKFIRHHDYFQKYWQLHRDYKLNVSKHAMTKHETKLFPRYELYHYAVPEDGRHVVEVTAYGRSVWKIKGDGDLLVAISMLHALVPEDYMYFWMTVRDVRGSYWYSTYRWEELVNGLAPWVSVEDEVITAREILGMSVAKCDTEYSLMLKITKSLPVYCEKFPHIFKHYPTFEEGLIKVVEEAPFKTVLTDGQVPTAEGIMLGAWNASAVYHTMVLNGHYVHYEYDEGSRNGSDYLQYCYTQYHTISYKGFLDGMRVLQIKVKYHIDDNNKLIVWHPTEDPNVLHGMAIPGYVIESVESNAGTIWQWKSDFPEAFHHIEAVKTFMGRRFDVFIIHNNGTIFKDMDKPWYAEGSMSYFRGGWLKYPS